MSSHTHPLPRECSDADGMLDFLQAAVEDSCEGLMIKAPPPPPPPRLPPSTPPQARRKPGPAGPVKSGALSTHHSLGASGGMSAAVDAAPCSFSSSVSPTRSERRDGRRRGRVQRALCCYLERRARRRR